MQLAASALAFYITAMLDIQPKQFRLTDEGEILFQTDPTNPLPGKPVGKIAKGDDIMRPDFGVTSDEVPAEKIRDWLQVHIHETLLPLAALKDGEEIAAPARAIADKLYDAFGILPRAALEQDIAGLDDEGRRALRARKIRLGPVLVFLPALNKPAAVRLRALLWNLWQGRDLPAAVPPDGVTSLSVAGKDDIDPVYFRAIGYPVYGPRAIRVDMLDRLITAVYDSAQNGVFKARHDMAEWLGCPIPDLYAVLEAMDHKKIHDPAEQSQGEGSDAAAPPAANDAAVPAPQKEEAPTPVATPAAAPVQTDLFAVAPEAPVAAAPEEVLKPAPQAKPELATFRLRRGKAYGRPPRPQQQGKPDHKNKAQKPQGDKKPRRDSKPRHDRKKPQPQGDRVISAAAPTKKTGGSPFDVLKDLKVQGKE